MSRLGRPTKSLDTDLLAACARQGDSYGEAAAALGVSLSTFKTRIRAARIREIWTSNYQPRLLDLDVRKLRALLKSGVNREELAIAFGFRNSAKMRYAARNHPEIDKLIQKAPRLVSPQTAA